MTRIHDAVIVGGGLVGASLALALQRSGLDVALIEPQPPQLPPPADSWDRRVYAISPGNAEFLRGLGVWERLDVQRTQRVEAMAIYGDRSAGRLAFSAYDAGLRELAWIVEGGAVQRAQAAAIAESGGITMRCPAQAITLQRDDTCARIVLADGTAVEAQLVVGTDGHESWVRRAAGIDARVSAYDQIGVVANFETEKTHGATALQWFREDGVLALLPLPGNRVSMVWSAAEPHARGLLDLDAQALAETVAAASGYALGGLRLLAPAAGFPLHLSRIARLVAPRVVLAGDAAHQVHPLAGQGVNLGFRDARTLASVLAARAPRQDCGEMSLLRRYERARAEDIAATGLSADTLQKLFGARQVWVSGVRNFGLGLVNRLPFLKNRLIRQAIA